MLHIYISALLIHVAFSQSLCKDGVNIKSIETKNPANLIGNWTYVYRWDNLNVYKQEFLGNMTVRTNSSMKCPELSITGVTSDYVKTKEAECGNNYVPFNWLDAKLRVDAPFAKINGGIIFIGEKDNWLLSNCGHMVKIVMQTVFHNYVVLINPDVAHISLMIARKVPTLEELKCVAHNVHLGKGLSGFGLCS